MSDFNYDGWGELVGEVLCRAFTDGEGPDEYVWMFARFMLQDLMKADPQFLPDTFTYNDDEVNFTFTDHMGIETEMVFTHDYHSITTRDDRGQKLSGDRHDYPPKEIEQQEDFLEDNRDAMLHFLVVDILRRDSSGVNRGDSIDDLEFYVVDKESVVDFIDSNLEFDDYTVYQIGDENFALKLQGQNAYKAIKRFVHFDGGLEYDQIQQMYGEEVANEHREFEFLGYDIINKYNGREVTEKAG